MSVFGSIMSKIFHHGSATPAGTPGKAPDAAGAAASPSAGAASAPGSASTPVDVAAVMNEKASAAGQKLDWQHSIVDLMKLLELDSSISARKQLADELHYTGDKEDSATMNVWLHKQVMVKLAENGGKVPDSLRA
jgi:uncharacterized protein DUF3597